MEINHKKTRRNAKSQLEKENSLQSKNIPKPNTPEYIYGTLTSERDKIFKEVILKYTEEKKEIEKNLKNKNIKIIKIKKKKKIMKIKIIIVIKKKKKIDTIMKSIINKIIIIIMIIIIIK